MSVQFGKCNFDGKPVDPKDLDEVRPVLAPYGPDGEGYICKDNFAILHRAFHTTKESRCEAQPHVSPSGFVLTWDGRLDNREELIGQLHGPLTSASTDLEIVAAAYDRYGTDAFARLIGDWSLSLWNPKDRFLILAKDFIGTRHLYYSFENGQATWCTILDPLVLFAGRSFELEEEYIAGWLAFFPAPRLTPYVGIHSVPPSSFVCLSPGIQKVRKYWDFDPAKRIRYPTDAEYEAHFRAVFSESVRRRLRSESPVLAELSGGMDSSAIVCMADEVIARGVAETPRLATISYFNDEEPNWNERPYFTAVEQKRGCAGYQIDVAQQAPDFLFPADGFVASPASLGQSEKIAKRFAECLLSSGSRVLLSGIGGDEVTGGIPTPVPELSDLLVRARFPTLVHQLKSWALEKRKPWFHLMIDVTKSFLPVSLAGIPEYRRPAPWLQESFARRYGRALSGYESRFQPFGALPSVQANLSTLDALRRQLGCAAPAAQPAYEKRYPYLDRGLLEFLYAVPREQILRPGKRRSLMRRALREIVPAEILNRRRKAFVSRMAAVPIISHSAMLAEMSRQMESGLLGIVDPLAFSEIPRRAGNGQVIPIVSFLRTIFTEVWLRALVSRGVLEGSDRVRDTKPSWLSIIISRETI